MGRPVPPRRQEGLVIRTLVEIVVLTVVLTVAAVLDWLRERRLRRRR